MRSLLSSLFIRVLVNPCAFMERNSCALFIASCELMLNLLGQLYFWDVLNLLYNIITVYTSLEYYYFKRS